MSAKNSKILAVPTNIVTGFLGAGKTSAIVNLLKNKPAGERWAVLVNEFGEIGVDGNLIQGQSDTDGGVHIREVPGGCMCCSAGLPMQIALTQLLSRAKPHRLLIEPTGLGHPLEVLQTLCSDFNREVIAIQKTLTLVDARNLRDERYTKHETFKQQLAIADVVVANKDDLYTDEDRRTLVSYMAKSCPPEADLVYTEHGKMGIDCLLGPTSIKVTKVRPSHSGGSPPLLASELPLPDTGYITAVNGGEGFESIGWRFSPLKVFDKDRLVSFLSGLTVERMKAVFITASGVFAYNMTRDALTEIELDDCAESRIEVISDRIDLEWEKQLTACLDKGQ